MKNAIKKYKALWILVIVLGVLVGVYASLGASVNPDITGELYPMADGEQPQHVEIENAYGKFVFENRGGEWTVESGGKTYRAHAEKMDLMTQALKGFTLSRVLESGDAQYGLETPQAKVKLQTDKGKAHTFEVGNQTVSANDNYVADAANGIIGVTPAAKVAQFTGSIAAYRDKEVFTVDTAKLVQIGYYDGEELALSLAKDAEGNWWLAYPFEAPARNIEMQEFLEVLRGWQVAGFPDMENVTTEEMGVDPAKESLMLVDANGDTQVLSFGNDSGTGRFVQNGGEDDIVMLYKADIDLSHLTPETMMLIAPLRDTVDKVSAISVAVDGQEYRFEVNNAAQTASVNGRLIDYDDFISVFYKYIMQIATGRDDAGPAPGARSVAVMRTEYADGAVVGLTLIERDEDTYFMELNGEAVYYMPKDRLDALMERVSSVAE